MSPPDSRRVPVPHLFMALSVALVALVAIMVLVAPSADRGTETEGARAAPAGEAGP
jgi:hypothetical protein